MLIIAGVVYWLINPPGRFGIARKGFVVYNKIPVFLIDCYIGPDGGLHLEADLGLGQNITYWFENHFSPDHNSGGGLLPLLIGNGFGDSAEITIDRELLQKCRDNGFEPHFSPSREAIDKYNLLREEGKKAGILLKVN